MTRKFNPLTPPFDDVTPQSHDHTAATDDGGKLTADVHDSYSEFEDSSNPSTPSSGKIRVYSKQLGGRSRFHIIDQDGYIDAIALRGNSVFQEMAVGSYYGPAPVSSLGDGNLPTQVIRSTPFYVNRRTTFDRIGVEVVKGDTAHEFRLGLYSNSASSPGYPDALLVGTGVLSSNVSDGTFVEATISIVVNPGVYWLTGLGVTTSTDINNKGRIRGLAGQQALSCASDLTGTTLRNGWNKGSIGQTTLPSTYPAGSVLTANGLRVLMRAA